MYGTPPRGRGRPRILRAGSRERLRKLYQSSHTTGADDAAIPTEILNDELEDDVFVAAAEISVKEAMDSREKDEWDRAIQSGIRSLVKNDTLETISMKKTFAPVARLETIQLFMAITVQYRLKIYQIDVVTAYLDANLEEEIIMEIPLRMEEALEKITSTEEDDPTIRERATTMLEAVRAGGNAYSLNKALYGLRQSGRQWHT